MLNFTPQTELALMGLWRIKGPWSRDHVCALQGWVKKRAGRGPQPLYENRPPVAAVRVCPLLVRLLKQAVFEVTFSCFATSQTK